MNGLIDLVCIWLHIEYQCLMFFDIKTSHMILFVDWIATKYTNLSLSLSLS